MPLANYTTKVDVGTTIVEIQRLLAEFGASSVSMHYEGGKAVGIDFAVKLDGQPLQFRLPVNARAAMKAISGIKGAKSFHKTPAHAENVAWRILKDWIRLQLTMVELQQAEVAQVFLPYALFNNGTTTETFYAGFRANRNRQLGSGNAG